MIVRHGKAEGYLTDLVERPASLPFIVAVYAFDQIRTLRDPVPGVDVEHLNLTIPICLREQHPELIE